MELKAVLEKAHSKANTDRIVKWIGSDQKKFDRLFDLFLHAEPWIIQRAAWPMSIAAIANPKLIKKHLGKLINNLSRPGHHDAVKRNSMRVLQFVSIPDKFQGDIMNIAFDYVLSPSESPAIKAFSLTVLEKLSRSYPEILPELKTIIEDRWPYETAAFHSRARKILKLCPA